LSIFKNNNKPVYHKIPTISFFNDNDEIKEKYIICNNCGVVHRVYEVLKSEIKWGMEDLKNLVNTKEDIAQNLNFLEKNDIVNILNKEQAFTCDWELAEHLVENNIDGNIILQTTESDNNTVYKVLEIKGDKHRIKKEIVQRYL
tara:strand:+ start:89 stop:520 length:432 start_codon:yes stop_codon:yes gene_type:complete